MCGYWDIEVRSLGEKLLLLGLLSFAPALAYACGEPHLVGVYPYKQLIDEADSIAFVRLKRVDDVNSSTTSNGPKEGEGQSVADVIAAARSAQQNRPKVRYIFDVIEMLWGVEKRELVVETYLSSQVSKQHDFDRHEDYRFWLDDGGATLVSSACDLVPRFEKDRTYLIVLGARASRKSYELVRNPERDAWYREVSSHAFAEESRYSAARAEVVHASEADDEVALCRDKEGPLLTLMWGHNPLQHFAIQEDPRFPSINCSVYLGKDPSKSELKKWRLDCERELKRYAVLKNKCFGSGFELSRFEALQTQTDLHCWHGQACNYSITAVLADQPQAPEVTGKKESSGIGADEALKVAIAWIQKEQATSIQRYDLTYKYEVAHEGPNWRVSFAPVPPDGKTIRGGDGDILVDDQTGKIVNVVLGQ